MATLHPHRRASDVALISFGVALGVVGPWFLDWPLVGRAAGSLLVTLGTVALLLRLPPTASWDEDGLRLHAWWGPELHVPWGRVRFVCPTPALRREGSPDDLARELVERMGIASFGFVLRDLPALREELGRRQWLAFGGALQQFGDEGDGLLAVDARSAGTLDAHEALVRGLEAHTRLDLIVYDWPE